jgi:hypothetical protein
MKRLLLFSFLLLITIYQLVVLPGCANIIPPSGGPRDSIPPLLLKAEPGDSSVNFKGSRITFTFDEFVDLLERLFVAALEGVAGDVGESRESHRTHSLPVYK